MDREGFRNRLKQYKQAREENPGLKYWEWKAQPAEKDIPKYDEGTDGIRDNTYVAPIEKEQVFIPATGSTKLKQDIQNKLTRNNQIKSGAVDIVSPEFDLFPFGFATKTAVHAKRMRDLEKALFSKPSNKVLSKSSAKVTSNHVPNKLIGDDTYVVSEDAAKELSSMYRRNKSKETAAILDLLGKQNTGSKLGNLRLNKGERDFLKQHNVDETLLTGKDIAQLKALRQQSILDALEPDQRIILTDPKYETSRLKLLKNTKGGPTNIGQVEYGHDPYSYMTYLGNNLNPITDIDLSNHTVVDMIENLSNGLEKGVSKDLYNGLVHVMKQRYPENGGFVTGMHLLSPEKTTKVLDKLDKQLISNQGRYDWITGVTMNNPIYSVTKTTGNYPPVKSLLFDPKTIKNGKIITDLTNPDIHFADGGEVGDNDFMRQFGKQVSYKPEETSWWSDVKNWWNDLTGMKNYAYGNCATTPNGKHTKECAHYSNSILRNRGYKNIIGDAWTRAANSGMKKITSGYDGLTKPAEWDESDAHDYLQSAANNFINNVDTTALNPYDVIGLYYPDSPNMKKAFEQGRWGETQTHTGHIAVGNDGTHYVVHNVGGHLKMNKLADMLTGDYDYLPVSAYRPKK